MTPAKISVIIATRNRAGLLPRAVDSVRCGSQREIVVVDDASTDSTPEVCAGLSGVEVIRLRKKRGLAAARNAGLAKCRGGLLAFLDDDVSGCPVPWIGSASFSRRTRKLRRRMAGCFYLMTRPNRGRRNCGPGR